MQKRQFVLWLILLALLACSGCGLLAILIVSIVSHHPFTGFIPSGVLLTGLILLTVFRPSIHFSQEEPARRWYRNPGFYLAVSIGSGTLLFFLGDVWWHFSAILAGEEPEPAISLPLWYQHAWTILVVYPLIVSLILSVCQSTIWRRLFSWGKQLLRRRRAR